MKVIGPVSIRLMMAPHEVSFLALTAMMKRSHFWLCCGPAIFCVLDCVLTLHGQPQSYWAGQYHEAVEFNPPFLWLLRLHPLGFSFGVLVWLLLVTSFILWLPDGLARGLAFVVQFAHTLGASSWLLQANGLGLLAAVALVAFSRLVMDATWERSSVPRRGCA